MKSLLIALFLVAGVGAQAMVNKVTVQGTGSVTAPADQADLSVTITTTGQTLKAALAANNRTKAALEAAVTGLSLRVEDLKSPGPTTGPNWVYNQTTNKNEKKGYVSTNNLTLCLKAKDFARVGEVIDAVSSVENTATGQVSYTSSKAEQYMLQALDAAVANATSKAERLAAAAKVSLSGVDDITEANYGGGRQVYAARAMSESADAGGATSVNPADLTFTATVTVSFNHN
jgi:uncharacterized protein